MTAASAPLIVAAFAGGLAHAQTAQPQAPQPQTAQVQIASEPSAGAPTLPVLPPPWAGPEDAPLRAAPPFRLAADPGTRGRAAQCLADAVYYEAANQPRDGQEAVAQVVLNRLRHPDYPKSVCGVVYQGAPLPGCQFTFACDGALGRTPDVRGWREAMSVALQALDGFVAAGVGDSLNYHALWVRPAWSAALTPTRRIGAHQFYRRPGAGAALTGVYAGIEPLVTPALLMATQRASARPAAYRQGARLTDVRAEPAARAAPFSVWGLQVAVVAPARGGAVQVLPAAVQSATASEHAAPHGEGAAQGSGLAGT